MKIKRLKEYLDYGCGFPVRLLNVPMVEISGEWVIDVNYNELHKTILLRLVLKNTKLTGNEIKFIRHFFEMTSTVFGRKFKAAHNTVLNWESFENNSARINWETEKDIRLFIAYELLRRPSLFRKTYHTLSEMEVQDTASLHALELDIEQQLIA